MSNQLYTDEHGNRYKMARLSCRCCTARQYVNKVR